LFRQVQQNKMALEIIRQVREAILDGKLRPGDRLRPEKELVTQFKVSKHTLREAMRALEAMGFIEVRKGAGGGPVVLEVDMETTRDSIANFLYFQNVSVVDLSEVRKLFEPYLARLAAQHISHEDLKKLEGVHRACQEVLSRGENMYKLEIDFHRHLARVSGNPVLVLILDFVNSLLADSKKQIRPGLAFSEEVMAAHQRIVDAIEARDGERAEAEMYRHVCEVEASLEALRVQNEAQRGTEQSITGTQTQHRTDTAES
jgi:GntR family transcriptional regulator, transcriptional repressor for pyruvate dehydrogenase complex